MRLCLWSTLALRLSTLLLRVAIRMPNKPVGGNTVAAVVAATAVAAEASAFRWSFA